jgi:hypothetical protein
MRAPKRLRSLLQACTLIFVAACSGSNDNSHTTATTFVSPPPHQILVVEVRPAKQLPADYARVNANVDHNKALLLFNIDNGKTLREGEEVVINFSLANAKLKGDGGEYRVRYIVDDEEMRWVDRWEDIVLKGWTPGKHSIRLELIGPDGWPHRNGDHNIITREINVVK